MEARNFLHNEIIPFLESLKRQHHQNDGDPWYSCPQSLEGCINETKSKECDCGATEHNAKIDQMILKIKNTNVTSKHIYNR